MNENQFGVLLENILDKVGGIAEGQRSLENKFDNLENKVNKIAADQEIMKQDIKKLKSDTRIIKSYMVAIDDGLNDHERRITKLEVSS